MRKKAGKKKKAAGSVQQFSFTSSIIINGEIPVGQSNSIIDEHKKIIESTFESLIVRGQEGGEKMTDREALIKKEADRILNELTESEYGFTPTEVIRILDGVASVIRKARAKILNKEISAPLKDVLKEAETLKLDWD